MKRSTWISLVDVFAFVSFLFLITTGFLLRYALPPGSGGLETGGAGWRAATRPVALVWGMTRHEWGSVHFWTSIVFLGVMVLHLFIHRRWIAAGFRGRDRRESRLQLALGIAALIGLLALAAAPFFAPKTTVTRGELRELRSAPDDAPEPPAAPPREGRGPR